MSACLIPTLLRFEVPSNVHTPGLSTLTDAFEARVGGLTEPGEDAAKACDWDCLLEILKSIGVRWQLRKRPREETILHVASRVLIRHPEARCQVKRWTVT
jgi:hypothetical protein